MANYEKIWEHANFEKAELFLAGLDIFVPRYYNPLDILTAR